MAKKNHGAKSKRSTKLETNKLAEDDTIDPEIKGKGGKSRKQHESKGRRGSRRCDDDGDAQLCAAIEADGSRTILKMADDGNCLFRSLSDQLYYDYGNCHAEVRSEICDFLEPREDEYGGFLVLDEEDDPDEDAKDFASYVASMREDGMWGGNLELVAAARLYRRNIVVFSANLAALTVEHDASGKTKPSGPDLWISYHDNQHYNSVRSSSRPRPPPRIKTYVRVAEDDTVEVSVDNGGGEDDDGSQSRAVPCASEDSKDDESTPSTSQSASVSGSEEEGDEDDTSDADATTSISPDESESNATTRPPILPPSPVGVKKGAICPCGSGLRYKKCCLAQSKREARLQRLREGRNGTSYGERDSHPRSRSPPPKRLESNDDDDGDDDRHEELQGGFRVLKI